MKFTVAALAASTAALGPAASTAANTPLNHPKFRSHLKCPYAEKWLTKGPEQAALELGLNLDIAQHQHPSRNLQELNQLPMQGSCSYFNPFSGGTTCMQFQGTGWTNDAMNARCAKEKGSTFSDASSGGCTAESMAGWCDNVIVDGSKHEMTAMELTPMSDCITNQMTCERFMSGNYMMADACLDPSAVSEETGESDAIDGVTAPEVDPLKCMLAPGAIGAAHQAGFATGYTSSCPGTPAQESPYMWPVKWSADATNHFVAADSDDILFESRGKVFYMLDKNWKRSDSTYLDGFQRTVGQAPCDDGEYPEIGEGCVRKASEGDPMSTMLHMGSLMYFLTWEEDVKPGEVDATKIVDCSVTDLKVIGNLRPDWFMDKQGTDTDVQYLGDQHMYYADGDIPKLVKQWRKKDFVNQYFVMSMMVHPTEKKVRPSKESENTTVEGAAETELDDTHWPMLINIPGEGFGDDSLSVFRNHKLLTEEDEKLFSVIEDFKANGGKCTSVGKEENPLESEANLPSSLEVDPLSWVSNEVTFSPIWEPVVADIEESSGTTATSTSSSSSKSVLKVSDQLTVESCYDESTKSMDMSIHFHNVEPTSDGLLPWMSIGYRSSDVCSMTPPGGGNAPILLVTQESETAMPKAHKTELFPDVKSLTPSEDSLSSMYTMMTPLGDVEEYTNVSVEAPMASIEIARSVSLDMEDTVSLHFKEVVEGGNKPEVMNLMYAIGQNSELGFHTTRGCFQVQPTPCGNAAGSEEGSDLQFTGSDAQAVASEKEDSKSALVIVSIVMVAVVGLLVVGFGSAFYVKSKRAPADVAVDPTLMA